MFIYNQLHSNIKLFSTVSYGQPACKLQAINKTTLDFFYWVITNIYQQFWVKNLSGYKNSIL